jgi:hypothetical protein
MKISYKVSKNFRNNNENFDQTIKVEFDFYLIAYFL